MENTGPTPTTAALFLGFLICGLSGVGGVLPWARRMLVEDRRWLSAAEFNDLLALCQFLPGPNVVNLSVAVGGRFRGPAGALAALTGLLAAPVLIVIALATLYARFHQVPAVRHAFVGLAAAGSALVLATALRIAAPLRASLWPLGVAALTFVAVAVLGLPLFPTMVVMAPLGILTAPRVTAWRPLP